MGLGIMKKTSIVIAIIAWVLVVVVAVAFLVTRTAGQAGLLKEETLALQEVNSIVVKADSLTVEVVSTSANQASIRQYGSASTASYNLFTVDLRNGSATINVEQRIVLFRLGITPDVLVVEIPIAWSGDVEISSNSGGIKLKNSFSWKNISVSSTSGAIRVYEGITATNLSLSSTSGAIRINGAITATNLTLSSTSGGISADKALTVAEKLTIDCNSGRIALNASIKAREIYARATSGGIRLGETDAAKFELMSNSGAIRVATL